MEEDEEDIFEVEEVLNHKSVRGKDYYYIHWKGFDEPEDNTWEPLENLENCLDLVIAYYLKIEKEIPKNITTLLNEIKEEKEELSKKANSIEDKASPNTEKAHQNQLEQSLIKSLKDNFHEFPIDRTEKISEHNSKESLIIDKTDDPEHKELSEEEVPFHIKVRERKNISYLETEHSNYDSDILENTDISENNIDFNSNETEEESKSGHSRSLWDIYGDSFKIKHQASTNKRELIFHHDNVVELDVAQICGRRTLNGEIEYLVEFDGIADRYCWINKNDLNCDKEVRKFERKKKKNMSEKSFSFFLHKYDNKISHPPPEEISRAHENVIKLRKELLGNRILKTEVPSKKKNYLKIIKIYEQNLE